MQMSQIMEAHKIYHRLLQNGKASKEDCRAIAEPEVRQLVESFAAEAKAAIIGAGDYYYFIPLTEGSDYHRSNEEIRKFLPGNSKNIDIYMMYLAIIILVGEFYNSYHTSQMTRDFLTISDWLASMNERLEALGAIGTEKLKQLEREYEYNWLGIIERWNELDIIKEGTKEIATTKSRKAFLGNVIRFLQAEELVEEVGPEEYCLTLKMRIIVTHYFMDYQYNRGILDLIYHFTEKDEEEGK
ncbi:MAG: DUF6063 family protein [Eubacteriales bacterium]|nr:DUF6063 family protein [Eubacteriales bacterium]